MQYVVMRYEIRTIHILHSKNTRQAKMKHFMLNEFSVIHFVAYIYAVWPVYEVGGNEEGRRATVASFSIFDSYDMKTL